MQIIKTKISRPPRIVLYGPHGIGKSTFGVSCPAPVFIQTEDGLQGLETEAFEVAQFYGDVISHLTELATNDHNYKTVVIDSLDWLEKLIFQKVCDDKKIEDITAIPYGRGYSIAATYWAEVLGALEILNLKKKMIVVLLAHAKITQFQDPERENYDRYSLDLQSRASGMVSEWCDILGFANYKIATSSKDAGFGQTIVKARSTGERVLNLEERPAYTAKNRYKMPATVALSWTAIAEHLKKPGNLTETKKELVEKKAKKIVDSQITV